MYLRRNFSFNQKNITQKGKTSKKKSNNIIRLKNNYNNNNKMNIQNIDDDISFYDNIATLKNQIFSPENNEDIYLYNNNKKMEKKIKYEDEKNANNDFITSRSIKMRNLSFKNNFNNNNKKTLILDLDETLVHSLFEPEKANNNIIKPDIYLKILFNNRYQEIFVYKRPFLDIFLKEMHKIYNIYVFTASIEIYAKPLLEKLDKNKLIIKKFYRESCLLSEGKFIKNLNSLNLQLKDIIIIDNNPISFKFNKNNGIPIKSWHFDRSDTELIKIIPLLKYLSKTDDVRKYIPYIVKNNDINFEQINKILQKQQMKIYKTINYNTNYNNEISSNNYRNPNTINYREPQKQENKRIIMKNFNKKNNKMNYNIMCRNGVDKKNGYKNNSVGINFNSGDINNKEKFLKSYNNFYIKSKYSFVFSQEKENEKNCETNLNNIINKYKPKKLKKKKKIPIDNKSLNWMDNKTSRIYKTYKSNININDNKNPIRHCLSYKNCINKENNNNNVIRNIIKMNNNYIQLNKNNTIETPLEQNQFIKNIAYNRNNSYNHKSKNNNNFNMNNLINSKYDEKCVENNETNLANKKQNTERFIKNNFAKRKIRLKNMLHRNNLNNFNQNIKSYSYSNFVIEN